MMKMYKKAEISAELESEMSVWFQVKIGAKNRVGSSFMRGADRQNINSESDISYEKRR